MSEQTTGPTTDAVVAIVAEALRVPDADLLAQPVLAAHDWDSLASLFSLAQLEGRFGITLDLRAFHAARTVVDLVGLVERARTSTAPTT